MDGLRAAGAAAGAAAVALAGWAALIEPRRFVVRRRTVRVAPWSAELDGLRVAVLSDLHSGGPHKGPDRIAALAERLAATEPDLALLLGDFVDAHVVAGGAVAPVAVARALAPLRGRLGTFAVLGNHDWREGGAVVRGALEAVGIRVLENEAAETGGLWIAGLADVRTRAPDVGAALAAVPPDVPLLVLSHDPDAFPGVPARASLTLSGHTHGGQVNLPPLRRFTVPSRFGGRFVHGLVREGGRSLLVTGGVGEAGLPVRLGRPPEGLLLTLRCVP